MDEEIKEINAPLAGLIAMRMNIFDSKEGEVVGFSFGSDGYPSLITRGESTIYKPQKKDGEIK